MFSFGAEGVSGRQADMLLGGCSGPWLPLLSHIVAVINLKAHVYHRASTNDFP